MTSGHIEQVGKPPHPYVFLLLMLPYGAFGGYVTVTLVYMLSQRGADANQIATVVAALLLPQTWKFLWAPVIDTTLSPRAWYLLGVALASVAVFACSLVDPTPAGLALLVGMVLLLSLANTAISMSIDLLLPQHVPEEQKGRASGWFQAGNTGGTGLGGGVALWLAQHSSMAWVSPVFLDAACLLCTLALLRLPSQGAYGALLERDEQATNRLREQMRRLMVVLRELWQLLRSRQGLLGLLVVTLPIGTGAASNLFSAVADSWHASADAVALANGLLGGVAAGLGALAWGVVCDRMDRKIAYVVAGLIQAACGVAMGLTTHDETMYVAWTLIYSATGGMTYAGFSAVAFECIGAGAAATKYNVFASLSNTPILYMGLIEGWIMSAHGPDAMLYAEAALGVVSMVLFTLAARFRRPAVAVAVGAGAPR